ncbi:MAG TPA: ABC transporter ATP-binding protein [Chloroflexota bacterium]|nr:ABC transporter ATP-binding protein [Chloroflexota bacterium]
MLALRRLNVAYGQTQVLWDVDLRVDEGEIVALIGSNGAGKSTLLNAISGLASVLAGSVEFEGRSLVGMRPEQTVRAGIAHVPQGRRLFSALAVRDNLLLGAYRRHDREIGADVEWVLSLFPSLRSRLTIAAGSLSGGEQQMAAIGRALMSRPRLLMIDEMSLGLAPVVLDSLLPALKEVNGRGTAILLVEQDVRLALETASRAYVLENGRTALDGPSDQLMGDSRVQEAYLGI